MSARCAAAAGGWPGRWRRGGNGGAPSPARPGGSWRAAGRERRAAELDLPVRFVLPDLAILGIAQRPPTTVEELRATRGVEERHARGTTATELMAAVNDGLNHPVELPEQNGDELDRHLRPAVT